MRQCALAILVLFVSQLLMPLTVFSKEEKIGTVFGKGSQQVWAKVEKEVAVGSKVKLYRDGQEIASGEVVAYAEGVAEIRLDSVYAFDQIQLGDEVRLFLPEEKKGKIGSSKKTEPEEEASSKQNLAAIEKVLARAKDREKEKQGKKKGKVEKKVKKKGQQKQKKPKNPPKPKKKKNHTWLFVIGGSLLLGGVVFALSGKGSSSGGGAFNPGNPPPPPNF